MEQNLTPATFTQNEGQLPAVQASASENSAIAMAALQKATVEARYKMALARPRDLDMVRQAMLKDAQRPSFANVAIYHKPVGKGIEGPSIRFVESAIRNMTNILTETATISEDDERRVVRVAVSDLETNTYFSQDVTVTKTVERNKLPQGEKPIRIRTNSKGQPVFILHGTDDDILNKQNALISKAVRTLGLRLIPGDLVDEALWYVRQTMQKQDAQNPDAAKNRLVDAFAQIGVAVEQLKEYVGHELSALSPVELQTLRAIYSAIKDGETSWKAVMDSEAEKKAEKEAETKKGARKAPAAPQQAKTAPTATEQASEPAETETAPAEPTDNDMFG